MICDIYKNYVESCKLYVYNLTKISRKDLLLFLQPLAEMFTVI